MSVLTMAQSARQQHARLTLISEQASIARGQTGWIGLRFELDPGWHIYWSNPGDSGEPPRITWQLPTGLNAGELQFPAPKRIRDHSLMDYGYEGNIVLLSKLTTSASAASNTREISADVRYLVCREVCVPAKDHVSAPSPEAAQILAARRRLPRRVPATVRMAAASSADSFILRISPRSWTSAHAVTDFIPADEQVIDHTARPAITTVADGQVITLKKSEQLSHSVSLLRGVLICGDQAYNIAVPVSSGTRHSSH